MADWSVEDIAEVDATLPAVAEEYDEENPVEDLADAMTEDDKKVIKVHKLTHKGSKKKGNNKDGTHAAHILSYEVFNTVYKTKKGKYTKNGANIRAVIAWLRETRNARIKSADGNLRRDRHLDIGIKNAIADSKILLKADEASRARRQINLVLRHGQTLPLALRVHFRKVYSNLKDPNGNVIIRANAKIYG